MFGLSGEHLILLTAVLFIFGPSTLPKLGFWLGKSTRKFKETVGGIPTPSYKKLKEEFLISTPPKDKLHESSKF